MDPTAERNGRWLPASSPETMATLARVLSEATRGLRRRIHTHPPPPPHAAAATPLLERLMRETDSGVKIALEEEEERERESSMATCQASFWEPLAVALRSSAPKKAQLVMRNTNSWS